MQASRFSRIGLQRVHETMTELMAEAIAEVMRHRSRVWAGGPKPPASARPPGGGRFAPAGRALASRSSVEMVGRSRFHRAGETRCVSRLRPGHASARAASQASIARFTPKPQ